ncbi:unnamed protein product [Echinostoma caproni]|uniref:Uncharacterized protein n=1 Tax=Echinostoma caproni TaxID=27848 RepID=A0A183A874_9TREM|nr:unnamed protein product [Echinostoma caproni]
MSELLSDSWTLGDHVITVHRHPAVCTTHSQLAAVRNALLNELHQTNVEILKRNKASGAYSDTRHATDVKLHPEPLQPTETDLDALSSPGASSPSVSAKTSNDTGADSAGLQYDWSAILDTLDRSDYVGMSNGYSYPPNESGSSSVKSPFSPNSVIHNGNGHSSGFSSPTLLEEQNKETRRAAEQAAQQLDDLLISLGQFKSITCLRKYRGIRGAMIETTRKKMLSSARFAIIETDASVCLKQKLWPTFID